MPPISGGMYKKPHVIRAPGFSCTYLQPALIMAIISRATESPPPSMHSSRLSASAIADIVVGIVFAISSLAIGASVYLRGRKRASREDIPPDDAGP